MQVSCFEKIASSLKDWTASLRDDTEQRRRSLAKSGATRARSSSTPPRIRIARARVNDRHDDVPPALSHKGIIADRAVRNLVPARANQEHWLRAAERSTHEPPPSMSRGNITIDHEHLQASPCRSEAGTKLPTSTRPTTGKRLDPWGRANRTGSTTANMHRRRSRQRCVPGRLTRGSLNEQRSLHPLARAKSSAPTSDRSTMRTTHVRVRKKSQNGFVSADTSSRRAQSCVHRSSEAHHFERNLMMKCKQRAESETSRKNFGAETRRTQSCNIPTGGTSESVGILVLLSHFALYNVHVNVLGATSCSAKTSNILRRLGYGQR